MKPLYEISNEYQEIVKLIEEEEELTPELLERLRNADSDLTMKTKNYCHVIKNFEAEEDMLINAELDLEKRRKKVNKRINAIKAELKRELEACNIKEVKTDIFKIRIATNPCKLTILDNTQVEDIYWKEKVTRTIDNEMIKSDLKNGILLDWAKLEKGTRLEIK